MLLVGRSVCEWLVKGCQGQTGACLTLSVVRGCCVILGRPEGASNDRLLLTKCCLQGALQWELISVACGFKGKGYE